mgnify:CR=1 FL=1
MQCYNGSNKSGPVFEKHINMFGSWGHDVCGSHRPQTKKVYRGKELVFKMRDGKRKPGYEVQSEPDWGC